MSRMATVAAVMLGLMVESTEAIWPFNRKKKIQMVTEEIVEEVETLYAKLSKLTFAPLVEKYEKVAAAYAELPVAEYASLPMLCLLVLASFFLLWLTAKLLDNEPYLYNGGKLGEVEKTSVYVCAETGKFKPPAKPAALSQGSRSLSSHPHPTPHSPAMAPLKK